MCRNAYRRLRRPRFTLHRRAVERRLSAEEGEGHDDDSVGADVCLFTCGYHHQVGYPVRDALAQPQKVPDVGVINPRLEFDLNTDDFSFRSFDDEVDFPFSGV